MYSGLAIQAKTGINYMTVKPINSRVVPLT